MQKSTCSISSSRHIAFQTYQYSQLFLWFWLLFKLYNFLRNGLEVHHTNCSKLYNDVQTLSLPKGEVHFYTSSVFAWLSVGTESVLAQGSKAGQVYLSFYCWSPQLSMELHQPAGGNFAWRNAPSVHPRLPQVN